MTPEEKSILLRMMDDMRDREENRLMDLDHARQEARAEGRAQGRAEERAVILAWLRRQGGRSAWTLVEAVERGEHLWEGKDT